MYTFYNIIKLSISRNNTLNNKNIIKSNKLSTKYKIALIILKCFNNL